LRYPVQLKAQRRRQERPDRIPQGNLKEAHVALLPPPQTENIGGVVHHKFVLPMSALGQKQTCAMQDVMSALPPKADICIAKRDVRFGPKADICPCTYRTLHLGRSGLTCRHPTQG